MSGNKNKIMTKEKQLIRHNTKMGFIIGFILGFVITSLLIKIKNL